MGEREMLRQADVVSFEVSKPDVESVTPRQLQVLRLVAKGLSHKEIGQNLDISPFTINRHLANVYLRLETSSPLNTILTLIDSKVLDTEGMIDEADVSRVSTLTRAQSEVMSALIEDRGASSSHMKVARKTHKKLATVQHHMRDVFDKLKVRSTVRAGVIYFLSRK